MALTPVAERLAVEHAMRMLYHHAHATAAHMKLRVMYTYVKEMSPKT